MIIVCLVKDHPPLRYFVNTINQTYPLSLAIVEKTKPSLSGRIASKLSARYYADKIRHLTNKKKQEKIYNKYFGTKWRHFDPSIKRITAGDINGENVFRALDELKPDIILDHGTSIVKNHICATASETLNVHWGLSPYYRGGHCSEWAVINWDPYNIGVTIHKLARNIDGGDIFAQKRAEISASDTVHSINMKLTLMGTEIVLHALKKLSKGEKLSFCKQKLGEGFLTLNRQWSPHLHKHISYIEKHNILEKMLKYPSRKTKMPIIEPEA